MSARLALILCVWCLATFAATPGRAIVGGRDAAANAYPFMVSLIRSSTPPGYEVTQHFCGGSFISPQWILTAAHCMYEEGSRPVGAAAVHVYVGSNDFIGGDRIPVAEVKTHPQYSAGVFANDIALLRLLRPPLPGHAISTIRLSTEVDRYRAPRPLEPSAPPSGSSWFKRNVQVAGWGRLGPLKDARTSKTLQVLDLRIAAEAYCRTRWLHVVDSAVWPGLELVLRSMTADAQAIRGAHDFLLSASPGVPPGTLCASPNLDELGNPVGSDPFGFSPPALQIGDWKKYLERENASCQGDSGGPLFAREADGSYLQVGIVSFGPGNAKESCGLTIAVTVYTSVAAFDDWIRSVIGGR